MPRTSASGDDAAMEQTVPSTTVDTSSGTGTTLLASSSDVNIACEASKQAFVVKPACRFGIKGFCSDKSSYVNSLKLACIGSAFGSSSF